MKERPILNTPLIFSLILQLGVSNIPGFVSLELALGFQLLFAQPRLFCFALLLEEESGAPFCHFILCFLLVLRSSFV